MLRVERKEISGATIRNYIKAIKLLCEMCEMTVSWKKVTRGLPKSRSYASEGAIYDKGLALDVLGLHGDAITYYDRLGLND
jgi:hypothetical protein